MKKELDRYFKEAKASIKDRVVLESVITGMKTVIIEATGDCPCGDPDCNGHCKYGLEDEKKEEPKQETKEAPKQEEKRPRCKSSKKHAGIPLRKTSFRHSARPLNRSIRRL